MGLHKDLTGADLHEPKGVASASANTVYVANGAGSGSWVQVGSSAIDTTSIKNTNRQMLSMYFEDVGTVSSRFISLPRACTLTKVNIVVQVATATATTVITVRNDAGTSMGTINIPIGALPGATYSLSPGSNNTFTADTKLQIDSDGGTTTVSPAAITLDLLWT